MFHFQSQFVLTTGRLTNRKISANLQRGLILNV